MPMSTAMRMICLGFIGLLLIQAHTLAQQLARLEILIGRHLEQDRFQNMIIQLSLVVLSFVDEYDWSGKTVIPFVTHGTGGLSATVRDLTAALPSDTTVLDAIGVYRPDVPSAKSKIQTWIAGLDLEVS